MKTNLLLPSPKLLLCRALFASVLLLLRDLAPGQELLKNPDFESPLPVSDPTAGWALVYADGGPGDFAIAGQTTEASRCCGGRGAHLRPNNWNFAHAYFRQVVTNLTAGARYTLTIQKMRAGFQNYVDNDSLRVYMAALSGSASNVVAGNALSNGPYSLTITCAATRQIEVRLHMWKRSMSNESSEDMKHAKCSAWFDDISLTLTP
ncbi:MAG: hypothetical protein N3I86_10610 [Verrucomicrobiae bacterium]|nr:hypothetical protein [Verrucomicrobiae bacterium]